MRNNFNYCRFKTHQSITYAKTSTSRSLQPFRCPLKIIARRLRLGGQLRRRFVADVFHSWERVGNFVAGLHLLVDTAEDRINRNVSIEAGSGDQRRITRAPSYVKIPLIGRCQLGQDFTVLEKITSVITIVNTSRYFIITTVSCNNYHALTGSSEF